MALLPEIPVFMRVGDGDENAIGGFTPEVTVLAARPGETWAECAVRIGQPLAEFLRAVADEIERQG